PGGAVADRRPGDGRRPDAGRLLGAARGSGAGRCGPAAAGGSARAGRARPDARRRAGARARAGAHGAGRRRGDDAGRRPAVTGGAVRRRQGRPQRPVPVRLRQEVQALPRVVGPVYSSSVAPTGSTPANCSFSASVARFISWAGGGSARSIATRISYITTRTWSGSRFLRSACPRFM